MSVATSLCVSQIRNTYPVTFCYALCFHPLILSAYNTPLPPNISPFASRLRLALQFIHLIQLQTTRHVKEMVTSYSTAASYRYSVRLSSNPVSL